MFASVVLLSGKDLTFSSRTVIWEGVTKAISHQFWRGYGYGVWENIWSEPIRSINVHNGFLVAHAHSASRPNASSRISPRQPARKVLRKINT